MKVRDLVEHLLKVDQNIKVKLGIFNQKYEEFDYDDILESDLEVCDIYGENSFVISVKEDY